MKLKDVTIKIVGKHIHDNVDEEQMELITEAQMYERNGILYLIYSESEFTGMEGIKTRLSLKEDSLKLSRIDKDVSVGSEMRFEKGKRFEDRYQTPMGPVAVEILTNKFENSMTTEGEGKLSVDYSISLKGLTEGRSRLDIEFMGGNKREQ